MGKPTQPTWAFGDPSYVIEPPSGKKNTGWIPGEKPFSQYMNWIHFQSSAFIDYFVNKTETIYPTLLRSAGSLSWNGSVLTFGSAIQVSFRHEAGEQINQFASGSFTLSDGQVVVLVKDKSNPSPVSITLGTYPTLGAAQYAIVTESGLSSNNQENETILFRRKGSNLEIPISGAIYATGTTFSLGNILTNGAITIAASQVTSGTFADARIAASNVTQWQGSLAIAASQVTSGTFADARIAASNVTQYQSSLALAASQITSGTLSVARGGTGVTSSTGTGNVVLSSSPTLGSFSADKINFVTGGGSGANIDNSAGTLRLNIATANLALNSTPEFVPIPDNTIRLGSGLNRWTEVWALDGSINTSDRLEKRNINKSDLGLDFINQLTPVSYKWKKGKNKKTHYGLIAQDVESVLNGKDFSGLYNDVEGPMGLNYSEFIGPIIKAIQELSERVNHVSN